MLNRFFITGTDTSVGKTVVSRALLQALAASGKRVAGYKPVAKGSKETADGLRNKDALVLQSVSSLALPYEAINPIALSEEESSVAHSCPINYSLLSDGLANLSNHIGHRERLARARHAFQRAETHPRLKPLHQCRNRIRLISRRLEIRHQFKRVHTTPTA